MVKVCVIRDELWPNYSLHEDISNDGVLLDVDKEFYEYYKRVSEEYAALQNEIERKLNNKKYNKIKCHQ